MLTTTGVFTEPFQSVLGCDSTVTLTLTVNPIYNRSESAAICMGENFIIGSQTLTISGLFTETFQTLNGCDSTVMLTLTVNPTFDETESASICAGESFVFGTQTLSVSGEYTEVFQSVQGCDSTVTLTLNVHPVYDREEEASICMGENFLFGSQTLTTAGIFIELFQSVSGCDSTVTLTLSINPVFNETEAATICEGDEYIFGTQTLTVAGEYTEVFQSVLNCDSTVVLTLNVNEVDLSVAQNDLTLTANATIATFQWVDCDNANTPIPNETGNTFTATLNGNYAVAVTQNGCTEISSCFEIVVVGLEDNFEERVSVYPNPVKDWLIIDFGETSKIIVPELFNAQGQRIQLKYLSNRKIIKLDLSEFKSGLYIIRIQSSSATKILKVLKD